MTMWCEIARVQEFLHHESRFLRTMEQSPTLGLQLHAQLNRDLVERMAKFRRLMSSKKVRKGVPGCCQGRRAREAVGFQRRQGRTVGYRFAGRRVMV